MTDMPIPSKIQMVTMTVGYNLGKFINLKVLHGIILDQYIVGIKCDNKIRGNIKIKLNKNMARNNAKSKDFKNQCTLIIACKWRIDDVHDGIKLINAKLFNNGKIIFTGCTDIEQIKFALSIITERLYCLQTICDYNNDIKTHKFNSALISDVIKKEVIFNKEYIKIILEFMILNNEIIETKINELCNADNYDIYKKIYTRLYAIKAYYPIEAIKDIDILPEYIYKILLNKLGNMFPSYIGNEEIITINHANINILNINSRMSCGFSIKKNVIYELLKEDPCIKNIYYDENIYPGIKAQFQSSSETQKKMEIIFFNSGKINITSTQTFAQIDEIYEFIVSFCRKHYKLICIERDDIVKLNKHIASLPNQYIINSGDDIYVLLKKTHIQSNPRNTYIIDNYINKKAVI
jgi:TATA-box binding protein (TBP) (component of TFIID and TFIIIB)